MAKKVVTTYMIKFFFGICHLKKKYSNNSPSQQYESNSKRSMMSLCRLLVSWTRLCFFLMYVVFVRIVRNPSINIHLTPHFTYHVIWTLPLFGGLFGPLMDYNGITWVLYVYNDSNPYKQSVFSLNRPSVPVNTEISWWPPEMPHCALA